MSTTEIAYAAQERVAQYYSELFAGIPAVVVGFLIALIGPCVATKLLGRRFGCLTPDSPRT